MAIVRVNFNTHEDGETYRSALSAESDRNFKILLALLSSYWQSSIDGPNYARELKAMAISLAKVRLSLDMIRTDNYYKSTRSEYIYQVVTSMVFPKVAPDPGFADLDFRDFLQNVVKIYFAGSVPSSMQSAVELFTKSAKVIVHENFAETRDSSSGFDISDEFGFYIDVMLTSPGDVDIFLADKNIRILLDIIRPAHTLYRIRYILSDTYIGQQTSTQPNKVIDTSEFDISNYSYDDFRKFVDGIEGVDLFGAKKVLPVVDEDVSSQF